MSVQASTGSTVSTMNVRVCSYQTHGFCDACKGVCNVHTRLMIAVMRARVCVTFIPDSWLL